MARSRGLGRALAAIVGLAALAGALVESRFLTAPPRPDETAALGLAAWMSSEGWSAEAFRTYPAHVGPAFPVLVALVRPLPLLRAVLLAAAASLAIGLARRECRGDPAALLPLLVFPYFAFSAVRLSADLPMVAAGLWGWWALRAGRPGAAGVLWTLAVAFRPVGAVFPIAAILAGPLSRRTLAAALPLAALAVLLKWWGGLIPASALAEDLAKLDLPRPEIATYAAVCAGVYVAPWVFLRRAAGRLEALAALVALPWFLRHPPRPNRWFEVQGNVPEIASLGLADRLTALAGPARAWVAGALFAAGVAAAIGLARRRGFHAWVLVAFAASLLVAHYAWDRLLLAALPSACALLARDPDVTART